MSKHAQQALLRLSFVSSRLQRRAEKAFVAADGALDLPPLPVDAPGEAPPHLCPIPRPGRPVACPLVQGDHRGADAQLFAAEPVIMLGVVGRIGQQAVQGQILGRLSYSLPELGRVVARPSAHHNAGKKVRSSVAHDRQFGPSSASEALVALALNIVGAGMPTLQARGVDGSFGAFIDQSELPGSLETSSDKRLESPFFSRRP